MSLVASKIRYAVRTDLARCTSIFPEPLLMSKFVRGFCSYQFRYLFLCNMVEPHFRRNESMLVLTVGLALLRYFNFEEQRVGPLQM